MSVQLIGASYRDNSLDDLELLAAKSEQLRGALFAEDTKEFGITGGVIVSTCNRFEVYFDSNQQDRALPFALAKISAISGLPSYVMKCHQGFEVTRHLFSVAAGLESMIVGEVEIAGQVKRALSQAQLLGNTTKNLEMLFQESARISKKVANETGLGRAGRSLVTGGLDLLKKQQFIIGGKRALVIGTGAYARVVIAALNREKVKEIYTFSPSGRAEEFSISHGTTPINMDGLSKALSQVDFVVACSGTHGTIITSSDIQALNKENFPIIDLSLARDVERSVEKLSNVIMIDLQDIHRNAPREHNETIDAAQAIINRAVAAFEVKLRARDNHPLVKLVRNHRDSLLTEELDLVFDFEVAQTSNG